MSALFSVPGSFHGPGPNQTNNLQGATNMAYEISMLTAMEYIDEAARDNRLYHYNGGQAYLKNNNDPNQLMIIDHASGKATCEVTIGTEYFKTYADLNIPCSARMREHSMVAWYNEFLTTQKEIA